MSESIPGRVPLKGSGFSRSGLDRARDGLVDILGEERLAVEPIVNVVKHLHVLRKHLQ